MADKSKRKHQHVDGKGKQSGGKDHAGALLPPVNAGALHLGKDCNYDRELRRLQVELVKLQEWIRHENMRVIVLFEGRDAAGKGGAIKRITESLNPRACRIAALATPTEREKTHGIFSGT